jgi:phospholipid/cholesterol/gamma-HCH transport system substrate-binding protein
MSVTSDRNATTFAALAKLTIFTVASLLVTGLLAVIMGNLGTGDTTTYHAVFTDASQLQKGDEVRVAGVTMGKVDDVELVHRTRALVTFSVKRDLPLTAASGASIRYLNLVGDRYLALTQGHPGAPRLQSDGTIPVRDTTPALDLTALFNGFQPLFAALSPKDVNDLSLNLVRTLQGEGGTMNSLLAHTASLTSSLADRDRLIGQVINNLDTMLGTVDNHHRQLSELVTQLRRWVGGLSDDRHAIGTSISNLSNLTKVTANLLTEGRPLIKSDVGRLKRLAATLAEPQNKKLVEALLDRLPETLTDQTRTGTYGSWYNYYLCDFKGKIVLPALRGPGVNQLQDELNSLAFHSTAARCDS